jgi:hypothetical protein
MYRCYGLFVAHRFLIARSRHPTTTFTPGGVYDDRKCLAAAAIDAKIICGRL